MYICLCKCIYLYIPVYTYLSTKCSPIHHHNGFMAAGALRHTHIRMYHHAIDP